MGWFMTGTARVARVLGMSSIERPRDEASRRQVCEMLEAYYYSNGLYDALTELFREQGLWKENLKPLRNPTYAAVEFYAMTLWDGALPEALPILSSNERLPEAIEQIWKWSNFGVKKQFAARQFAMTGDLFMRIATNDAREAGPNRVYIQVVKSKNVVEHEVDEQGHVTWLRYEVRRERREGERRRSYVHTEVWSKADSSYRLWEHDRGYNIPLNQLGTPVRTATFEELFGVDFLPWVHAPFRDTGETEGLPLIWPVLDKIDEVNRKATRASQMMFLYNDNFWALEANQVDAQGRPVPAPIPDMEGGKQRGDGEVVLNDMKVWRLPGNAKLVSLVPKLDYDAYRNVILDDLSEIARDLPEIRWYDMIQGGNESGRALLLKMGPGISKVLEARGTGEIALQRIHAMALSVARALGLDGFTDIGSFENGDFEHRFADREVIPMTLQDQAETARTFTQAGMPLSTALKRYLHFSEEDIADMRADRTADEVPASGAIPVDAPEEVRVAMMSQARAALGPRMESVVDEAQRAAVDAVEGLLRDGSLARFLNRNRG